MPVSHAVPLSALTGNLVLHNVLLSELQMMQAKPAEMTLTVLNQALSCQRKYSDQSASLTVTLRSGLSK